MSGKYAIKLTCYLPNGDHLENRVWVTPIPFGNPLNEDLKKSLIESVTKSAENICNEIMKQENTKEENKGS